MNRKIIILIILLSTLWFSCEKELNITDFEDDFGNYEPELKVEGLLQQDKPEDSIIRIIKTSSVTDIDVFDGEDNDNDGEVDEYDEVLPLVQDTSASVKVVNLTSGDEFEFIYVTEADSFPHWGDDEHADFENDVSMISYAGYKPKSNDFKVNAGDEYRLEIYSEKFDLTITGVTSVYPPVEFIDTLYTFDEDLVVMKESDDKELFWKSDLAVTSYYARFSEIIPISEQDFEEEYLFGFKTSRDNDLTKEYKTNSIGRQAIWGIIPGTIMKLTVEALSPEYGKYIFSSLPMNDPERSNLTDQNGDPVLGCFGASAAQSIYIIVEGE